MSDDAEPGAALFGREEARLYRASFEADVRRERVALPAIALVCVLGLVGLFGTGPLARATAPLGPHMVGYDRLARIDRSSEIRVELADSATPVVLWMERDLADRLDLGEIVPAPSEMRTAEGRIEFAFAASGPTVVEFRWRSSDAGWISGAIGLAGGPETTLRTFLYP